MAAFIDGRLEGDERQQMLVHLNRCERCYELFTETVRCQQEEELQTGGGGGVDTGQLGESPSGGGGGALRRGPWGRWPAVAGLAASLVVAAGVVFILLSPGSMPRTSQELVARLGNGTDLAQVGSASSALSTTRGITEDREDAQRAFRLGVSLVDLSVAISVGDATDSVDRAQSSMLLAEEEPFCTREVVPAFAELKKALEAGASRMALATLATTFESQLMGCLLQPDPWLPLGRWAAAGYLAAKNDDAAYFAPRSVRRFPGQLEGVDESYLSAELAAVESKLERRPSQAELQPLKEVFRDLIYRGGGRG
jgi:hypothetical protein